MSGLPATGRAAGKVILLGEHAVVYGHPALAAAVPMYTRITLRAGTGPTRAVRAAVRDARLLEALARLLPHRGVDVEIRTELPVGRGMGSSASLAVALVRAAADLAGDTLAPETAFARALEVERLFHGNPSGIDVAVILREGAMWYRRGPPPEARRQPLPTTLPLVVLDTGAAGDTGALVAAVAGRRPAVDPILERIGQLADRAVPVLGDLPALGALFDEAHGLLRDLGVSTPPIEELATFAREHGALGAKPSGAGGGGVVIALTRPGEEETLRRAAGWAGINAFTAVVPQG
ncbi:MAG: mevalonate kinase [Deltaproteobacteria bacterium]|nr:mevalonate kinase [Deltaproteobacteria bacterium]